MLEETLDLGYEDDTKDKEIEGLKSEVARLKREVAYGKEGIESRNVEVARYKRLYEKALDQMTEMTLKEDLFQRMVSRLPVIDTVATPVVPRIEEAAKIEEAPKIDETPKIVPEFTGKMNVNTARGKDLIENLGMSRSLAYQITSYRKRNGLFVELEELLEVKAFSKKAFEKYKDYLTIEDAVPVTEDVKPVVVETKKKEKVNVNTANIYDLMEAGFGKSEAGRIVRWVKKYGEFKNLDDLTKVDGVTGKSLRKIRDNLEV
jgi:competence ComEA-like helix-hairpin-helix protein